MKITFLGTNGWYDTETGNTVCILIETKSEYLILDAGNGFYKIGNYIKTQKPIYLFLSHFHLDHISGLHILNKFNFRQGLHIYGQIGTKRILNQIVNRPFTVPLPRLPFKILIHEISEGNHFSPFHFECRFLLHASRCMGFRFKLQDRIITYCTDTGRCSNILKLAKNADLLITECSYGPDQYSRKWPHLNPQEAAIIAKKAEAKKLALIHFDASIYLSLKDRQSAEKEAKKTFKKSFAAADNLKIKI
jgi:ribonuclease BN (tRNA processing enzyme)